jgi:lysophospholipase L1-like esterase
MKAQRRTMRTQLTNYTRFLHISAAFMALAAAPCGAQEPSKSGAKQWESEIAKFEKADAESPPHADAVLFVGSSSIRFWETAKAFPELATINRGFGGSQICDATQFADELVVKHKPRMIVFYAGDNDINAGKSAEQVHVDFAAFVAKVREALPKTPIVFIAIKPSIARWAKRDVMREANRLIAADCEKDETLQFLDVWPVMLGADSEPKKEIFREDGLHMNETGYKLWNDLMRPILEVKNSANH